MEARFEPKAVRALFDEMAATYGIVNVISSFGFAARWRHHVVKDLPIKEAAHVVDLMSGMSELCRSLAIYVASEVRVTAIDISPEMIRRARKDWPFPVEIHLGDVLSWEFEPGCADVVICSFGLKTFDRHQQAQLAKCVARMLRPGGWFSFVEISVPPARLFRWAYLIYLNKVIPWIGRLFLGNPSNYRMLGVYTREFGSCKHFAECLRAHSMEVAESRYFFGCATGVRGVKPIGGHGRDRHDFSWTGSDIVSPGQE
jgi:demethylmenaquinone methyltransferase/2-methoxy-6-polyprenyl-1,4-benzoquinol methylase